MVDEPSLCLRLTQSAAMSEQRLQGEDLEDLIREFEESTGGEGREKGPRDASGAVVSTELTERDLAQTIPVSVELSSAGQERRLARAKFRRYPLLEIPAIDPTDPALRLPPILEFELTREARGFAVIDGSECRRIGLSAPSGVDASALAKLGQAALRVGVAIPMVIALAPAEALAGVGSGGTVRQDGPDPVGAPLRTEGPGLAAKARVAQPLSDLPDASWQGLVGRSVEVSRTDGSLVIGEVTGSDATTVTLIGGDGSVLVVARGTIASVRVIQAQAPTATAPAAGPPPTAPPPSTDPNAPEPVPPPPVDEKGMRTGTALVISGAALMGAGLITTLVGAGVSLRQLTRRSTCGVPSCSLNYDPGYYALVIVVPGVAVMFGVGLPLLIAGAAVRGKAKRGATALDRHDGLVFNHTKGVKKGQPKLTLAPSGPRQGWGGGLRLRF